MVDTIQHSQTEAVRSDRTLTIELTPSDGKLRCLPINSDQSVESYCSNAGWLMAPRELQGADSTAPRYIPCLLAEGAANELHTTVTLKEIPDAVRTARDLVVHPD